jgi:hypothetical protein
MVIFLFYFLFPIRFASKQFFAAFILFLCVYDSMFSASIQNRSMVVSLRSTRFLDQFTYSPFNLFIQAWSSSKKSSHERDEITYSQCDVLLAVSLFFMSCRMDYYDNDGEWKPESGESVIIVNPRADYRKEERGKFLIHPWLCHISGFSLNINSSFH